jgi:hypothetical protein
MNPETLELLIPITAIVMGTLVVLIPIAGATARFALKPIMEAIGKAKETQGRTAELTTLEQRVALLESQFNHMEGTVDRLAEAREFDRQLGDPRP